MIGKSSDGLSFIIEEIPLFIHMKTNTDIFMKAFIAGKFGESKRVSNINEFSQEKRHEFTYPDKQ